MKIVKTNPRFILRFALIIDLILYVVAIIGLALLPLLPNNEGQYINIIETPEWVIAGSGLVIIALLLGRLFSKPFVPGNQYAYLMTALYGMFTAIAFTVIGAPPVTVDIIIIGLLVPGIAGGIAGHILDGGKSPTITKIFYDIYTVDEQRRGMIE